MFRRVLIGVALGAAVPAFAQEGGTIDTLDSSLAEGPVEGALTVAALRQLQTGDKGRVSHALYQLEALMALPGFRAEAVTDALEKEGALQILRDASGAVKGKTLQALHAGLIAEAESRLGARGAKGAKAVTAPKADAYAVVEPAWTKGGDDALWLAVDLQADRELELHLEGCPGADASLFDPSLRREGTTQSFDDFTPARLWAQPGLKQGLLRVRPGLGCAASWQVGVIARTAPPALAVDLGSSATVKVGKTYRVRPASADSAVGFDFAAKAGTVYAVETRDLVGRTDTRLHVTVPDHGDQVDDDGGAGLASRMQFDTLHSGKVQGFVELMRSDASTTYELRVDEQWAFQVGPQVTVNETSQRIPSAVWSNKVVPLAFDGDTGTFEFQATRGTVYRVHADLDVEVTGNNGGAALPLLADDVEPEWAIRPMQAFLALDSGPFTLTLRKRATTEVNPVFFQLIADPDPEPVPHMATLGPSRRDPLPVKAMSELNFDGGVIDDIAPGEEGWIRFVVDGNHTYRVFVDGADPDGRLVASLYDSSGRTTLVPASGEMPYTVMTRLAGGKGTWVARVANMGDTPARVRVAVLADEVYNGLRVGDEVKLGRHRVYNGHRNWSEPMERYVGRNGRIISLAGQDGAGAWLVRVDVDGGEWAWRTRDASLSRRVEDIHED